MEKKISIKLTKSVICCPRWMRTVVRTLGLRKTQDEVIVTDNGAIRGMIKRVPHLLTVKGIEE
jgi:large subunit ribosomal protein L30